MSCLPDQRVLLIHFMMWGSWRIYRRGEPGDRPFERARVIFCTHAHIAVVFAVPVIQVPRTGRKPRGILSRDPPSGDFPSLSDSCDSSTWKRQVGMAWADLDYFQVGRLHLACSSNESCGDLLALNLKRIQIEELFRHEGKNRSDDV